MQLRWGATPRGRAKDDQPGGDYRCFRLLFRLILVGLVITSTLGVISACAASEHPLGESPWVRQSLYVPVRDGTKLAVDIFRPVRDGQVVTRPLPVLWIHHRYQRATFQHGRLFTILDQLPWLNKVLEHDYVIAAVDARGSGASFGTFIGATSAESLWDAYDITEWLAVQPWSDGNIGMFGRSAMGLAQLVAAATAPPHLRAIFPEMPPFDPYSIGYSGGILRSIFTTVLFPGLSVLDQSSSAARVDADQDGALLAQALIGHKGNVNPDLILTGLPYRNSTVPGTDLRPWIDGAPWTLLDRIGQSGVPIYLLGGWFDLLAVDTMRWYSNLSNPRKLIFGPWSHNQDHGLDMAAEHLRWYDYWLKGIDNGIMAEPPILYYRMGAPIGQDLGSAWQWPLPQAQPTNYYFGDGRSGTVDSENDGTLSTSPPLSSGLSDSRPVEYAASTGRETRWVAALIGGNGFSNLAGNDRNGFTYTSPPLTEALEITGHPIVRLWASSTATDGDFFVYLEVVDRSGYSLALSEGALRASHRATAIPPFNDLGHPFHGSYQEDIAPLQGEPVELALDLTPISVLLKADQRLRVTITGADRDNASTPNLSPVPIVSIHRGADFPSYITLPTIPPS